MKDDHLIVQFDFRDFKYLSNVMKTQVTIRDPEVIVGLKNASIELDFKALVESDEAGLSRFINGGRVYFEANVFGYQTSSFTTKGFFDQLGYVEPIKEYFNPQKLESLKKMFAVAFAYLVFRVLWRSCCRSNRPSESKIKTE